MVSLALVLPFLFGYVPGLLMPGRRWRWIFGISMVVLWVGMLFSLLVSRSNEIFVLLAHGLFFGALFGLGVGAWLSHRRNAGNWGAAGKVAFHAVALVASLVGYGLIAWGVGAGLDMALGS